MIPYSRPIISDFYTLSHTKLLENCTLYSGTYPYRLYMRAEIYKEMYGCGYDVRAISKATFESKKEQRYTGTVII